MFSFAMLLSVMLLEVKFSMCEILVTGSRSQYYQSHQGKLQFSQKNE